MNTSLNDLPDEVWKPIPGFPGYDVSNMGRVRSYFVRQGFCDWQKAETPQRILQPSIADGFPFVGLMAGGKRYTPRIHALVTLAFIGPRPGDQWVQHIDGDSLNNQLENLRYEAIGVILAGRTGRPKKFSNEQARHIREEYSRGAGVSKLCAEYDASESLIWDIVTGKRYVKAGGPIRQRPSRFLPRQAAREIRERAARNGVTLTALAEEYDRDLAAISRIVNGKTHKNAGGPIKGVDYAVGV